MSRGRKRLPSRPHNKRRGRRDRGRLARRTQDSEPAERFGQDFFLLAERKPNMELSGVHVVVENDARNRDHAGLIRQLATEFQTADVSERPDVGHDEEGAVRAVDVEARGREPVAHKVPLEREGSGDRAVVLVGQRERGGDRVLKGPPLTYVRNCFTVRTAETISLVPVTQPIFQPVNEKVFAAELIETVRSRMPGSDATGTCSPVY